MRRIDGKRRQHREDVVEEIILEPGGLRLGQTRSFDKDDPLLQKYVLQFAPAVLLRGRELGHLCADPGELLWGVSPSGTGLSRQRRSGPRARPHAP